MPRVFTCLVAVYCALLCAPSLGSVGCDDLTQVIDSASPLYRTLSRKAIRLAKEDPQLEPVIHAIQENRPISIHSPLELTGSVSEASGTLTIRLDGIGPTRGSNQPSQRSIKDQKVSMAGIPSPNFQPAGGLSRSFARALIAVVRGIEERSRENPDLKRVIVETVDIMNLPLRFLLENELGFEVTASTSIGGGAAYWMRLEVWLKRD